MSGDNGLLGRLGLQERKAVLYFEDTGDLVE